MVTGILSCLPCGTVSLILLGIVLVLYLYGRWRMGFFERRGIKSLPFDFPLVGHMFKALIQREHFVDTFQRHYYAFPSEKYVGHMQLNKPTLVLKDLDLIKQIGVKDFDHFPNHLITLDQDADSILGSPLLALKGDKWRDMRATLSPAFTSSKMRGMFKFITEIGQDMVHHYMEEMNKPENKERGLIEIEMKDAFTRYTNDVIATVDFGIKVNSFKDPDNTLYRMGKESINFSAFVIFKGFLLCSFPRIMKMLKVEMMDERIKNFFRNLVNGTMEKREKEGIVRHDMINLLMEAKKGVLRHEGLDKEDAGFATVQESEIGMRTVKRKWTDDELVAQAVLFYINGFDSIATTLSFVVHELAVNPAVQTKLQAEVDEMIRNKGEHLDYSDLVKMNYMDNVVSETLRLWPPVPYVERACVKSYKLPPSSPRDQEGYEMQVGEGLWIPIYSIQRDPKYFPNPDQFDPERYSEENKKTIRPMSYIPFGVGPRNCIGCKLALVEIKAVMFYLMAHFDIVTTAKTQIPMNVSKKTMHLTADKGFWVGLKPRKIQ